MNARISPADKALLNLSVSPASSRTNFADPRTFEDAVERLHTAAAPQTAGALVVDALRAGLAQGKLLLAPNGHWRSGDDLAGMKPAELDRFITAISLCWELSDSNAALLAAALLGGRPTKEYVDLGRALFAAPCTQCGEEVAFQTNGQQIRAAGACPLPKGAFPIEFELNVPSGKLVFANGLREYFNVAGHFDVMSPAGLRATTLRYAEEGLAHCYLPHSSHMTGAFSLYKLNDGLLLVEPLPMRIRGALKASIPRAMYEDLAGPMIAKKIGRIAVGPVWWSGADFGELRGRFRGSDRAFETFLKKGCLVVNVPPGSYRVGHYESQEVPGDEDGISFHSAILRAGDPKTGRVQARRIQLTAGQIVWHAIRSYPGLYLPQTTLPAKADDGLLDIGRELNRTFALDNLKHLDAAAFRAQWLNLSAEDRERSLVKAVNSILLGSSYKWDAAGWCACDPGIDPNGESVAIPKFGIGHDWETVSLGFGTIFKAAGIGFEAYDGGVRTEELGLKFNEIKPARMNESFRELAFNVLQSIIRSGVMPPKYQENQFLHAQRLESPKVARLLFNRLAKLYPESVPVYCRDLLI